MTNQQKEVFVRVQASVAYNLYNEREVTSFNTEDLEVILEYVDEQTAKLECVRNDLEDVKSYVEALPLVHYDTLDMVNSTLLFLNQE